MTGEGTPPSQATGLMLLMQARKAWALTVIEQDYVRGFQEECEERGYAMTNHRLRSRSAQHIHWPEACVTLECEQSSDQVVVRDSGNSRVGRSDEMNSVVTLHL